MLSIRTMTHDLSKITDNAKEVAGGPSALAKAIGGLTSQAVSSWDKIPMKRVFDVSRITGIPPHKLRPDIIPDPGKAGRGKA